eukprot:gene2401-8710_t
MPGPFGSMHEKLLQGVGLARAAAPTSVGTLSFSRAFSSSEGGNEVATSAASSIDAGIRAALMPLTLKAKAASANMLLWEEANLLSKDISKRAGDDALALGSTSRLSNMVLQQLQKKQKVPPMKWYYANMVVQGSIITTLSLSLKQMSTNCWPGLTTEGPMFFVDLSSPPVYLQTLSTPFGSMGALMPLALVLIATTSADKSAATGVAGISSALKVGMVPLYIAAITQPHAVLLYWLTNASTTLGVQLLQRSKKVPEAVGASDADADAATSTKAADDIGEDGMPKANSELLLSVGAEYGIAKNSEAASVCFKLANEVLVGAESTTLSAMASILENKGQWEEASRYNSSFPEAASELAAKAVAYSSAAELCLKAVEVACHLTNSASRLSSAGCQVLQQLPRSSSEPAAKAVTYSSAAELYLKAVEAAKYSSSCTEAAPEPAAKAATHTSAAELYLKAVEAAKYNSSCTEASSKPAAKAAAYSSAAELYLKAAKYSSSCAEAASEPAAKAAAYSSAAELYLKASGAATKKSHARWDNNEEHVAPQLLDMAISSAKHAMVIASPSPAGHCLLAKCHAARGNLDEACASASQAAAALKKHTGAELSAADLADEEATWQLHLDLVDQLRAVGQDRDALLLASAVVMHTEPTHPMHGKAAELVEKIPLD